MKNKKIIAFIAALSIFFGTILSILGDFNVYANENNKLIIGQIINEESKKILEDGIQLDYMAEKISDEQMKINIKINAINEEVNTDNYFVDFSFLDYFDILEEKIEVTNPELNNDEFKKAILETKVVENKGSVAINLSSIDKSGTEISFIVKLKDLKDIEDKIHLELKTQLKRNEAEKITLVEELQKIQVEVLNQKEPIIDDTTNLEDVDIDLGNEQEIRNSKIGVEKTINPFVLEIANAKNTIFEVTLNVTNETSSTKTFTVKDYIDTNKFEFVETNGTILNNQVTWKADIGRKKTSKFTYKIKFKDTYEVKEGLYMTNPKDKKGQASYSYENEKFEDVFIIAIEEDSNSGENNKPQKGELKGEKSVLESEEKDGTYDITFDITGKPEITSLKSADIVFMIDKSGSMSEEMPVIKESTILAANKLLNLNEDPNNPVVRIALGTFSEGSSVETEFISDKAELFNKILEIKTSGGTNTQSGILTVKNILSKKRENAESYVLFFSDGLPNRSLEANVNEEIDKENAIGEYKKHFSQYSIPSNATELKKTKFYSVGMFTDNKVENKAVNFMYEIQNGASDKETYKDKYFTNNTERVKKIFDEISSEIKGSIMGNLATNAVLSDEIAAEFEYVQGQEPIVTTKVNNEIITLVKGTDYTFTVTEKNKIVFNFPKIPLGGVKATFKIKLTNDYFGTYDKDIEGIKGTVKTNGEANLTTNEFPQIDFESPTVSISYKKGIVKITKNIDGEALSSNDKFIIGFNGPSRYNVEINGAGETILDFYLKDDKTNIDNNSNINLNYMLAGQYTVNELIPMNYSNDVKFEVKVNGKVINGKTFTIDKDNTNIEIMVTNKVANRSFLNDRSDKSNIFNYK